MTEIEPPVVVNTASARGTGQIPDKEDQMYVVTRDELYLVLNRRVPVTNIHRDEIIEADHTDPLRGVHALASVMKAGAAGARPAASCARPPVRQGGDGLLEAVESGDTLGAAHGARGDRPPAAPGCRTA
ncbi:MAG: hypothetical protein U0869_25305 [Chloroflexota bacterium]